MQTALLREVSVGRRLGLAWSLSASAISAARGGLARSLDGTSRRDVDLRFVEVHYGAEVATGLRADLSRRDRGAARQR